MTPESARSLARRLCADAMLAFPLLFVLVFLMHFHDLRDMLHFGLRYEPASPEAYVTRLIHAGTRRMWIHDPHVLGFLSMPAMMAALLGLAWVQWRRAPGFALLGAGLGLAGSLYLASLFGIWSALFAIGKVPPQYTDGAIAAWRALTAPEGVFGLTTTLSRVPLVALLILGIGLWRSRVVPRGAAAAICGGTLIVLAFVDLDNWMLLGMLAICAGMVPARRALLRES